MSLDNVCLYVLDVMCVVLIGTDFEMFAWLEDLWTQSSDPGFLSRKSWVLKGMVSPLSFYRHSHGEGIKDVCQSWEMSRKFIIMWATDHQHHTETL